MISLAEVLHYLTVQVEAGGRRKACQEKQRGGQADRLHDEEQVIDQNPHKHQPPGFVATVPRLSEGGTHHIHTEEDCTHGGIGAAGHIPAWANRACFNSTRTLHFTSSFQRNCSCFFHSTLEARELTVLCLVHSCTSPSLSAQPEQYSELVLISLQKY